MVVYVRFQILTAASMKFKNILARFLTCRHPLPIGQPKFTRTADSHNVLSFRARLIHCPDDGGSTHVTNVGQLRDYKALHPRRL
jgi:hypothetical protein